MNCECFTTVNGKLKEKNLKLRGFAFMLPDLNLQSTVETEWIDKQQAPKGQKLSPPRITCAFCPFCGKLATKEDKPQ